MTSSPLPPCPPAPLPPYTHVVLSEHIPPTYGGVARFAYELAAQLAGMGHRTVLYGWRRYTKSPLHDGMPFTIAAIPDTRWKNLKDLHMLRVGLEIRRRWGSRVILYAMGWKIGRALVRLAPLFGWRVVIFAHGLEVTKRVSAHRRPAMIRAFNSASLVVPGSRYTARALVEYGVDPERVHVINYGVDPERFRPGPSDRHDLEGRKVILTLARVIERKGQDMIIRALPQVRAQVPHAVYIIAGVARDPERRRLETLAREHGVSDAVIWAGYISEEDLAPLYNACDVYAMVSREIAERGDVEGFGITYLEAGACAKPVIGGRSGGVEDAVEDGVTGFLVDPHDPDAVAERLTTLLTDDVLARRLGENGRARIERSFTWRAHAEALLARVLPDHTP